jgi:hypothetical protein
MPLLLVVAEQPCQQRGFLRANRGLESPAYPLQRHSVFVALLRIIVRPFPIPCPLVTARPLGRYSSPPFRPAASGRLRHAPPSSHCVIVYVFVYETSLALHVQTRET